MAVKIKIIKEVYEEKLEKKVNDFMKKEKIKPIHVETRPVIREIEVNNTQSYQKRETYEYDYMATIIYEE